MGKVTTVKAGQTVPVHVPGAHPRDIEVVVLPKCGSIHGGQWYCVTHKLFFANQLDQDTHIREGDHLLLWNCFQHGFEEP